jgi:hypothetical protein
MSAPAATPHQLAREAMEREVSTRAAAGIAVKARLVGFVPVKVPLRVSTAACGLPELVHAETGDSRGICASIEVAERIRNFFA